METDNQRFNATVQPNSAFLAELKEKLPEFFTRENSFDLEKFQAALKEKNVSELSEGYQLNFIGKDYARRQAGEMPTTVIVPDEDQNNGAGKNSQNLFFTGDNLEVLRHLQNNYQNKIDVIYIDPPYNTGSDGFVYPDSFEYSDDKLKEMFGMNDDQVARLKSIQGKSSHSAWLTFMYPRLALAKRLLNSNGKIFISIDENEIDNLKIIMNEIYGEINFMGQISVVCNPRGRSQDKYIATSSEFLVIYSKNVQRTGALSIMKDSNDIEKDYGENDEHGLYRLLELRNTHRSFGRYNRPNLYYPLYVSPESGKVSLKPSNKLSVKVLPDWNDGYEGCWTWSKTKVDKELELLLGKKVNGTYKIYRKDYAKNATKQLKSIWDDNRFYTDKGQSRFNELFSNKNKVFSAPKSDKYIKQIVQMSEKNSLSNTVVLDFFAGSSTTADAVMQLNAEDGGHRKFIMVQLPEKTYHTNKDGKMVPTKGGRVAFEDGFRSIDEISRERIRRAAAKIKADNELTLPADFDGSFKHYRVVKPSRMTLDRIEEFNPQTDELVLDTVDSFSSQTLGVAGNASGEQTVLATWLAKDGYPFDVDVQKIDLAGYQGNLIENNRLYLIREDWSSKCTEKLLNLLGTHALNLQAVVIFGYSFNLNDLRELENGLKQLDGNVSLIKRY